MRTASWKQSEKVNCGDEQESKQGEEENEQAQKLHQQAERGTKQVEQPPHPHRVGGDRVSEGGQARENIGNVSPPSAPHPGNTQKKKTDRLNK